MRVFLGMHGHWVGGALIVVGAGLGWIAMALLLRWVRRRRALGESADAPAPPGPDYPPGPALLRGVLRADGASTAIRTYAAGAGDVARASVRVARLVLVTTAGVEVELRGRAHVVSAGGPRQRRPPREVEQAELASQLPVQERWPFEELPVEVRTVGHGAAVEVFGCVERLADGGAGYRDRAARATLGPGEAGLLVLPAGAPLPLRRALAGALLGGLATLGALAAAAEVGPGWAGLVAPTHHARGRAILESDLAQAERRGMATAADLRDRLALLDPNDIAARLRTLEVMGRHDDAVAILRATSPDPIARASTMRDHGYLDAARAELRAVEGVAARAEEVRVELAWRGLTLMLARPDELEDVVRSVCGDDLGCASTARIFEAPYGALVRPLEALFGARTADVERATTILSMLDAVRAPSPELLAVRIRWRAELALGQLQLGAGAAAWRSIARAHADYRALAPHSWEVRISRQLLRELRTVAHLRAGHPERAPRSNWGALGALVVIARGGDDTPWPHAADVPELGLRLHRLRTGLPIPLDVGPGSQGYEEVVWYARLLTPAARARLGSALRSPVGTIVSVEGEVSRANALRALGDQARARRVEASAREMRRALYGW